MSDGQVGVVIVTHGPSGADMLMTLERLLGADAVSGFASVEAKVGEDKKAMTERIQAAIAIVERGAGVLVACDLHGSTPANCAVGLMRSLPHVAVISGVSLPMLIKLATMARTGLTPEGLARAAVDTAIRSTRVEGEPG